MSPEQILEKLVAIPSPSGQEAQVADFVTALAESWGYQVHRFHNNVWFEAGQGGPRLLMLGHLDTVPPCEGWQGDPYKPVWHEGHLTALGANDAKGPVSCILAAAKALVGQPLDGTVVFTLSAEEETGNDTGIGQLLPMLGPLDAALVAEPTNLQPAIAQRGRLVLACKAQGQGAHVEHAFLAKNAIHKASLDIARLAGMVFESHPLLGATKPQVTKITGGDGHSQVPDVCEFLVDLRTTPNLEHEELAERIARELESEVKIHASRYQPKATDAFEPIAQAALSAGRGKTFVGSASTSDWAFLGDIPTVKVGPGDTHRSHRPNEFITAKELQEGAVFYQQVVRNYFAMMKKEISLGR
ncbi:MAG: peptidase [Holophagaceae bacterium]|nr:peptidase [Holophagaceae bacterium]